MSEARLWWSALAGYVFHTGHSMFMQDVWGLEKYIEVVKLHWVDLHWSVGLGVMCLGYYILNSEIKKAKKEVHK